MDPNETMVEENFDGAAADDALPEGISEETDVSEDLGDLSIDDGIDEGETAENAAEEPAPQASEPGWIKQRVNKAVQKAIAETEARMNAMFEERMAPIFEKMIEDEAQDLVRSRKVGDIETARELVRFRRGQQASPVPKEEQQPRNEQGQFAPKEDAAVSARIDMLQHQADRIKANGGPDVIAAFKNDEDIKAAVVAGEMDFYDVAEQLSARKSKPPAPTRSPNGASGSAKSSIAGMTKEQFARLEKRISEGARFNI